MLELMNTLEVEDFVDVLEELALSERSPDGSVRPAGAFRLLRREGQLARVVIDLDALLIFIFDSIHQCIMAIFDV